ncbi:preprotein translocase subunit SecE [Propioniciclava coleopterorum]|uniref:Protein translocase subunit SecE n=1 Tax=Propioniciclava coleopterorum TaxID=2714937 RepID=A0A6G7Y3S5_9ACTN|nr:preprotein translocase subunit SecE [Propioniciclava coleopterorum]QIK71465.1 preprotein translocase subunit SecE [Propioniciclava coleopterorum]
MFDGSSATPDEPARDDLPGEFLADDLNEPEPYEVSAEETEAEELIEEPAPDEGPIEDADQLVAAESVAQQARSSRPVRRTAVTETPSKGKATAKRPDRRAQDSGRVGPIKFAEQSVDELKKVVWPTWQQVSSYFWAVLVFVLVIIAYVSLLDLGLGALLLKLFG